MNNIETWVLNNIIHWYNRYVNDGMMLQGVSQVHPCVTVWQAESSWPLWQLYRSPTDPAMEGKYSVIHDQWVGYQ